MIIYQLHEYGGEEYEYSYDRIIGSYLRKERAEEEKAKAEAKEIERIAYSDKCDKCPYLNFEYRFLTSKELIDRHSDYCAEAKLKNTDYGMGCDNYYSHWDKSTFKIEEVEVEE